MTNHWMVELTNGKADLRIALPVLGRTATVRLNGDDVAHIPMATGQRPWVEYPIPDSIPPAVLVLVHRAESGTDIRLFVSGRDSLGDDIDVARRRAPLPIDRFEESWRDFIFLRPEGAWLFGGLMALPFIAAEAIHPSLTLLGWGVAVAVISGIYARLIGGLVRGLARHTSWPFRLRNVVVAIAMLWVPLAVIGLLASAGR